MKKLLKISAKSSLKFLLGQSLNFSSNFSVFSFQLSSGKRAVFRMNFYTDNLRAMRTLVVCQILEISFKNI